MSDAPERVWVETNEYDSDMGPYFAAYIYEWEGVEYIRADIHPARCVGDDGIDHQSYTEAALEEAQVVTDLRAENARLREECQETRHWNERVSVCRTHTRDIVDGPCVICENARLREALEEIARIIHPDMYGFDMSEAAVVNVYRVASRATRRALEDTTDE